MQHNIILISSSNRCMSLVQPLKTSLLVIGIYNLIVFLMFLAFYVKRVNKLDKLASSHIAPTPSLKIRIVLILTLIILQILHILLSYFDVSYFMYEYNNESLVEILSIFDFILQIYIITRQHQKKTRSSRSVVAFWLLIILAQLSTVVVVQVFQPNLGIILNIASVIVILTLITLTMTTSSNKLPNIQQFKQSTLQTNLFSPKQSDLTSLSMPSANDSMSLMNNNQRIYIEIKFQKEFDIELTDSNMPQNETIDMNRRNSISQYQYQCSFKIAVYICGKYHIINKSQTEFVQLAREMKEFFPNSQTVLLHIGANKSTKCNNIVEYGEERQKIYQQYLVNLTKTDQFYAEPLMNFLDIHSQRRNILEKSKIALLKRDTVNTAYEQRMKRPFFTVVWKQNKIFVSNPQILQFYINKSNKQIIAFHNRLINQKKLQMQIILQQNSVAFNGKQKQKLKQKQLTEEAQKAQRSQICHFIELIANNKYFWQFFAEWMCLGSTITNKIKKMFEFWQNGFANIQMSVIGYQPIFDQNNTLVYYYLLSLTKSSSFDKTQNTPQTPAILTTNPKYHFQHAVMLKKRYNDFVKLDWHIRKYISSESIKNAHIPSLPPKFSPFENKTSPHSRRIYFDAYIKDIIKIAGINHCVKLLQFFQELPEEIATFGMQYDKQRQKEKEREREKDKGKQIINESKKDHTWGIVDNNQFLDESNQNWGSHLQNEGQNLQIIEEDKVENLSIDK